MSGTANDDLLVADLASMQVQIGVRRRWWCIDRVEPPQVTVTFAVPPALFGPGQLTLVIDCAGYPAQAPTAWPVDPETGALLPDDRRPKHGRCGTTFRSDWEGGRALYLPVDRVALAGHPDWAQKHAHEVWDPELGIAQHLAAVRAHLLGGAYDSVLVAA